jgi:hypothetical protein
MNRRGFLNAILKTAAATALPSEVWPFRKIFLPPVLPRIFIPTLETIFGLKAFEEGIDPESWSPIDIEKLDAISRIQLEVFRDEIPMLCESHTRLAKYFRGLKAGRILDTNPRCFSWDLNADQWEAARGKYAQGIDVQAALDEL